MRWVASHGVCTPLHWAMYYYTAAVCEGEGLKLEVRVQPSTSDCRQRSGPRGASVGSDPAARGTAAEPVCVCVCVCVVRGILMASV